MTIQIIADVFILMLVAVLWSGFDKRFVAAFLIPVAIIAIIATFAPLPPMVGSSASYAKTVTQLIDSGQLK
jgi:hypothetical protein